MFGRHIWRLLCVLILGCHSLLPVAVEPIHSGATAQQLWEKGQTAMRGGQPDEAIGFYQQSLAADASLTRNHLSLAAAYLEKGDEAGACPHLAQYVWAHPEHLVMRARHAELLLRLQRLVEARTEFERFVADAQEQGAEAAEYLIHCQSRLMDIAEAESDEYGEHLHRGIGLFLLARKRAGLPDPEGELPVEGLLCKAAGELTLARHERPSDARACWYLHEIWSHLGQQQPAVRWLRAADEAAPFSYLTPSEQRGLHLAWQQGERVALVK